MRTLKQSTAYSLVVFMTDSSDHVSGKTGLTLSITASKAGAAFASISPTVTELVNGWYKLALTTSHTDTLGDLAIHITGTGADPTDLIAQVTGNILGDTLPVDLQTIKTQTVTCSGGVTIPAATLASTANITAGTVALTTAGIDALFTRQLTESYNADGTAPTVAQALLLLISTVTEFSISGTTITAKKLDGSTTAATFTLDDATNPTSRTRAT